MSTYPRELARWYGKVLGLASALLLVACGDDKPTDPALPEVPAPEFSAVDVNSTSPRHEEMVSPRDYIGQVSAWYFGHAT